MLGLLILLVNHEALSAEISDSSKTYYNASLDISFDYDIRYTLWHHLDVSASVSDLRLALVDTLHAQYKLVTTPTLYIWGNHSLDIVKGEYPPGTDTFHILATEESMQHFYADGPNGSAYPRVDSVKEFRNPNGLNVLEIFQTWI